MRLRRRRLLALYSLVDEGVLTYHLYCDPARKVTGDQKTTGDRVRNSISFLGPHLIICMSLRGLDVN